MSGNFRQHPADFGVQRNTLFFITLNEVQRGKDFFIQTIFLPPHPRLFA